MKPGRCAPGIGYRFGFVKLARSFYLVKPFLPGARKKGRLFSLKPREDGRLMMPFNIQVNHMFVDGVHLGMFKEALDRRLAAPM